MRVRVSFPLICLLLGSVLTSGAAFGQFAPQRRVKLRLRNVKLQDEESGLRPAIDSNKEMAKALLRGRAAIEKRNYLDAIEILQHRVLDRQIRSRNQRFVDESEDHFLDQTMQQSIKREALQLIGELPKQGRRLYEQQFGITARQLLDEATKTYELDKLQRVVRRFFHTEAGFEATYLLGTHYLDHSLPLAAALQFDRLRDYPERARSWEPMLSLKTAVAWMRAGMPGKATRTLRDLKKSHTATRIILGNRSLPFFNREGESLDWLMDVAGGSAAFSSPQEREWTMFRGNSSRNAAAPFAAPALQFDWLHSGAGETGEHDSALPSIAAEALSSLEKEHRAKRIPTIPAVHPLIVGDRLIYRTLQNVRAVDGTTGALLWETSVIDPSYEHALDRLPREGNVIVGPRRQLPTNFFLRQRAWADLTAGTLSANGELVFTLEELGYVDATNRNETTNQPSHPASPQNFNKLMAFELSSGKLMWEVGGQKTEHPLPLAGTFFLGPPLPIGDELYCLVEKGAEILLQVLDARSGDLQWSQSLVLPELGMKRFVPRRMVGISPSYANGVLVCPTAAGAVIAVDLTRKELLWGHRYSSNMIPPQLRRQAAMPQGRILIARGRLGRSPSFPLHDPNRWIDFAPTLAQGYVLLTPRDSGELSCLNIIDGSLVWKKPRDQGLYLAAVYEGTVIVVGRNTVEARRLSDGEEAWKQSIPIPMPSGRGYRSGRLYQLPLSTGEVATIDLKSGRILARSQLPAGWVPGNLIVSEDSVVSQTVGSLVRFRGLAGMQREIAAELSISPDNAAALALRGEIQLHSGHEEQGLADLRRSNLLKPDSHVKALIAETLLEGLRLDFAKYRSAAGELENLISDRPTKVRFLRMHAAGLNELGEQDTAFGEYLKLATLDNGQKKLESSNERLSVRNDRWTRFRLADAYAAATSGQRLEIESLARKELDSVLQSGELDRLRWFIECFGDLKISDVARRRMVGHLNPQQETLELEKLLRLLRAADDSQWASFATARLAALLINRGLVEEAEPYLEDLAERWPDVVCLGNQTGRQLVDQWMDSRASKNSADREALWPDRQFRVTRSQQNAAIAGPISIHINGPTDPRYEDWSLSLDLRGLKIIARDGLGRSRWDLPIQGLSRRGSNYRGYYAYMQQHLLVVLLGNYFSVYDTLSHEQAPKLLWSRNLHPRSVAGRQNVITTDGHGHVVGSVGPVTDEFICYRAGSKLYAADPLTGETFWERDQIPAGSVIFGDAKYIIVVSPGLGEAMILRGQDGEHLGKRMMPLAESWVAIQGRLLVSREIDATAKSNWLKCVDVSSGQTVWKQEIAAGTQVVEVRDDELAVLEPSGHFAVYAVLTGAAKIDVQLAGDQVVQKFIVRRSRDRYILLTQTPDRNGPKIRVVASGGPSHPVHGFVYGFDRRTGVLEWSTFIEHQSVGLDQPLGLPVLVLAARLSHMFGGRTTFNKYPFALSLLDTRNGRIIYQRVGNESVYPYASRLGAVGDQIEIVFGRLRYDLTLADVPLTQALKTQVENPKNK